MWAEPMSPEEWERIQTWIDNNFGAGATAHMLRDRTPVRVPTRKGYTVFMVPVQWLDLLEMDHDEFELRHAGEALADIVGEQVRLSLSAVRRLSEFTRVRLVVSRRGAEAFTYGRSIIRESVVDIPAGLRRGRKVVVVDEDGHCLGLAVLSVDAERLKLLSDDDLVARNLVDIGWFVRHGG